MKIALVSLDQIWEDKESNWHLCKKYVRNAARNYVEIIVFPEMTLTGFSSNVCKISENIDDSQTIRKFCTLAKKHGIAIVFGMALEVEKKYFNYCIFVSPDGLVAGKYAKIHPFSFAREDRYFSHGDSLEFVQYKGMNIGFSICYDLRFPEIYSAMSQCSDLIINIANWPKKRLDHWEVLLKARAIENQIFFLGVNRTGVDGNGLEYVESSHIYNANGERLDFESMGSMRIFTIDKQWQKDYRDSFNTINDKKAELYRRIM